MTDRPRPHRPRPLRLRRVLLACAALALAVVPAVGPVPGAGAVPAAAHGDDAGLPSWWYDAMKLSRAHEETTGKGVTVAVIDVAIDPSAADIRGADVTLAHRLPRQPASSPPDAQIGDHGTAMVTNLAGTGHGNAPGGLGVRGIAPDAKVRFYGMDTDVSTPAQRRLRTRPTARPSFDQAVDDGADIITTSLGFVASKRDARGGAVRGSPRASWSSPPPVTGPGRPSRVDSATRRRRPARSASTRWTSGRSRGSTTRRRTLRYGSLEYPVISAPGVKVDSSGYEEGRGWASGGTRTGTSDAAPIVAGALALVKSKYPDATGNQLVQAADPQPDRSAHYGWDAHYGFGIVSVSKHARAATRPGGRT